MDATKNDDSGGSDSLDKSLQRKCVVDDVGQGEGSASGETLATQRTTDGQRPGNSSKKQKTEKQVGDGNGGGSSSATNELSSTSKQISNKQDDKKTPATITVNTSSPNVKSSSSSSLTTTATDSVAADALPTTSSSISNHNKTDAANCNNNNAFETKVKQISKNLKETTLAETTTTTPTTTTFNKEQQIISDESTSVSTSSTPTPTSSATSPDGINNIALNTDEQTSAADIDGLTMNSSMISDSNDDADSRSKKVRFHPDVKENDGGNRVIPKKKKKLKASSGSDGASTSSQGDEMDLDEEDDYEEEEDEFDLAKTIAEAQDYLKEHPLTFVRPCDKSAGRLQNGLLEEDDIKHLDTAEEEEFIDAVIPENGIERILGKQTKGGRVEFLLRFTNQPGLFWESEDFIATQCPSLLTQYEFNRERRQERLMRHVAKRQNLRQRYTDF